MKTDYFKANMSLLRLFHSKTYNTIIKAMTEPMGRITMLPNGLPDLKVNDNKGGEISLHDNPDSEISEYLSRVPENEPSAVILLGMGLGYTPEALVRHRPQMRQLIIFEFFTGIFIQTLHTRDLSQLLSDPRVILSVGPEPDIGEVLTPAYKTLQLEHIHILRHLPSFSINMAGYQKLHDKMFAHVNRLNIGGSTIVKMGKHFLENRFCNLTSIRHNRLIDSLKDKFSGIPAILVASGPSLDENVHLLAKAKGKAVIIAIDSALPSLLAHGVKPDFITALDPDDVVYEKIAAFAAQAHGINLVCQLGVTPKTPKIFPADQIFWAFNDNILTKLVNISLGGKINIGETHSNAHLNLVTAIVMGASPIIFVGQDLAFTGGKSHTSHTVLKEHDTWEKRLQETDDTVLTDAINGGKVKTHRGFFAAKVLFEKIMAKHPNRYINATAAGVHLQGTETLSLDEAIERFCSASTGIKEIIKNAGNRSRPPSFKKFIDKFRPYLNKTVRLLEVLKCSKKLITKIRKDWTKLKQAGIKYRSLQDLPPSLVDTISSIDRHNREIDSAKDLWNFVSEATLEELKKSERMRHNINLLANQPDRFMDWLDKSMERLSFVNYRQTETLSMLERHLRRIIDGAEQESSLLDQLNKADNNPRLLLKLARLYFDSDDFVLLKTITERLSGILSDSAENLFYLGSLAALWTDYEKANAFFDKAIKQDPLISKQIITFRYSLADAYLTYAETYEEIDRTTCRALLLKGLLYCPEHKPTQLTLQRQANEALSRENEKSSAQLIKEWQADILANETLAKCLTSRQISRFAYYHGKNLVQEGAHSEAVKYYQKALTNFAEDPQLHISLTDALFSTGDFNQGVQHLHEAVRLDPSLGHYWEEIADTLQTAGQHNDAIMAYEQCFMAQPTNTGVLKKIGDCYLTLDKKEAAYEAYSLFKSKRSPAPHLHACRASDIG